MKNRKKKLMAMVVVSLMLCSTLIGCREGTSQNTKADEATGVATVTDAAESEETTVKATTEVASADKPSREETTTENRNTATEEVTEKPTTESEPVTGNTATEKATTESPKPSTQAKPSTEAPKPSTEAPKPSTEAPKPPATTEDTRTECEKNGHQWEDIVETSVVHHDAEYKEICISICKTCGWEQWPDSPIDMTEHYNNSELITVNAGTEEEPWWVEINKCGSCYSAWKDWKVKDAWDETVTTVVGKKCKVCGTTQ